uniref:WD repeat-containing protein 54 beta-propeller domain-containing protein n=1 Tax=Plectus sambesii TaxID=2011161 RepID=A0A914VQ57_9BILA
MYEFAREIAMSGGSASSFPNNISTFFHEGKNLTFTAMAHKYQVNMVHWDSKLEGFTSDQIQVKEPSTDKPLIVVQAKYVLVSNRSFPLLAVASTGGAMVFDPNNGKMLAYTALPKEDDQTMRFVRGISYVDNLIMMGTHTGEILIFNCSGESSVKPKPTVKEHTVPIVDIATCHFDDLTCTCDVDGHVIVWSKNMKSTTKKI